MHHRDVDRGFVCNSEWSDFGAFFSKRLCPGTLEIDGINDQESRGLIKTFRTKDRLDLVIGVSVNPLVDRLACIFRLPAQIRMQQNAAVV
jgi:hypothetical protein